MLCSTSVQIRVQLVQAESEAHRKKKKSIPPEPHLELSSINFMRDKESAVNEKGHLEKSGKFQKCFIRICVRS